MPNIKHDSTTQPFPTIAL